MCLIRPTAAQTVQQMQGAQLATMRKTHQIWGDSARLPFASWHCLILSHTLRHEWPSRVVNTGRIAAKHATCRLSA